MRSHHYAPVSLCCVPSGLLSRSDAWTLRRESLPAGEVQRYEAQYRFIQQICALYEEEPNEFGKLFTLIQEVRLACLCSKGWCLHTGGCPPALRCF